MEFDGRWYRPPGYESLADDFWQKMSGYFGITWRELLSRLSECATQYSLPENPIYSLEALFNLMLYDVIAPQSLSPAPQSGTIVTPFLQCTLPCAHDYLVTLWVRQADGTYRCLPETTISPQDYTTIIIHGWNPGVSICAGLEWATQMADRVAAERGGNVLIVDWRHLSTYPLPTLPGQNTLLAGLWASQIFKENVVGYSPARIHIIGHSFGSYVAAVMSVFLGHAGHPTSLDPAPDWLVPRWVRSVANAATLTDSYKSSQVASTLWAQGRDSFALESLYTLPKSQTGAQHSYAYQWFSDTIGTGGTYGFNWSLNSRSLQGLVSGSPWLGFIYQSNNIPTMACWDMRSNPTRYDPSENWHYNAVIPSKTYWGLINNVARCVEMEDSIVQPVANTMIKTGQPFEVSVTIHNHADNQTLPGELLLKEQRRTYVMLYLINDDLSVFR